MLIGYWIFLISIWVTSMECMKTSMEEKNPRRSKKTCLEDKKISCPKTEYICINKASHVGSWIFFFTLSHSPSSIPSWLRLIKLNGNISRRRKSNNKSKLSRGQIRTKHVWKTRKSVALRKRINKASQSLFED